MSMLHDDITLSRLIVYAQSIEESKLGWIDRNFKMSGSSDQGQSRSKKRAQTQDGPSATKVIFEKLGGSQRQTYMCYLWKEALWGMSMWKEALFVVKRDTK